MSFKICTRIDSGGAGRLSSGCHLVAAAGMGWDSPKNFDFRALQLLCPAGCRAGRWLMTTLWLLLENDT